VTSVQAWHTDVNVITFSGGAGGVEGISFFSKGTSSDTGAVSAAHPGVTALGVENVFRDCRIGGGKFPLNVPGIDNDFDNLQYQPGL
jgi:hypothetical protein